MSWITLNNLKTFLGQLNSRFATKSSLATVATSGKYSDLANTPTVDSTLSSTSTNAIQNKAVNTALSSYMPKTEIESTYPTKTEVQAMIDAITVGDNTGY